MLTDPQKDNSHQILSQQPEPVTAPPNSANSTAAEAASRLTAKSVQPSALNHRHGTFLVPPKFPLPFRNLPSVLQWIPANCTWPKWKPVLRSALSAWICLLLFLIPKSLNVMGQAGFLIIIASFLSPPSDPFIAVLQREFWVLLFATSAWAWSCLGIFLANTTRSYIDPAASPVDIFAGRYIEAAPTAILAVFLFIGSFVFLYLKSRMGPGPFIFASIFGCICVDISLTTAVLFPYPLYTIGRAIIIPLSFHSAVALTLSLCLFPASESTAFTMRLQDVLLSLVSATKENREHLLQDITAPDFSATSIVAAANKAESGLGLLLCAARLQKFDVTYSRFAPSDYGQLHSLTRKLVVKVRGMCEYYALIDPTRERFPVTPVSSIPATPTLLSSHYSRPPSPGHEHPSAHGEQANDHEHLDAGPRRKSHHHPHTAQQVHHNIAVHHRKRWHSPQRHTASHHSTHSHSPLVHSSLSHTRTETAVGVFESLHYLNLEATHLFHPDSEAHITRFNELLSNSCQDLLGSCELGLKGACDWLNSVRDDRFNFWVSHDDRERHRMDKIQKYKDLRRQLSQNLDEFTSKKRVIILDPYRPMLTPADESLTERETTPDRHLFYCYRYQYHLMRFASNIQDVLNEIVRLETERKTPQLWCPVIPWLRSINKVAWEPAELAEGDDDEDPDIIPGLEPASLTDLGDAVRRDPDALPPRNVLETVVNWIYYGAKSIGGGNSLFALKAGVLTILLSLPTFLESSAGFAYRNKFVWAIIMGQLTLSRFRGDTTFGLVTRIVCTFVGGIIGMVMWYISTGSGRGNAFGLAAVCLVCFPFFFFFRLYWPVPPMTNLIIWVTAALIYGYSYQDTHFPSSSSPGYGFDVAWKRFTLVTIGVVAAGIFSFLPPSTTIRLYQRKTLATTATEIGYVYCSVISFGSKRKEGETHIIVQHLLAIASKLTRSVVLKQNVVYEFSLRGKWPAERYQRILELQIQICGLLSNLTSVLDQMEPAWAHAFLKRTRLSDADFQGDVLAVISLISSSLRNGNPLPQVTPCPLLNRFMERYRGLNVAHEESEEDSCLPKALTKETLESLQFMIFCVGVSTAFGIVIRLDKLMVAAKELVGEQFHIDGLDLPMYYRSGQGLEMRTPVRTVLSELEA